MLIVAAVAQGVKELRLSNGGPTCPQSLQAAQKLTDLGYTNVRAYEGGLCFNSEGQVKSYDSTLNRFSWSSAHR